MSYKITNTALDHTKRFLHRTASKMQMEPVLAGRRLRIRSSMVISDELFEHNKPNLELYRSWGVLDWKKDGEEKATVVEPTVPSESKKDPSLIPPMQPENATPVPESKAAEAAADSTGGIFAPPASEPPVKASPDAKTQLAKSTFKGKKQEGG